MYGTYELRFNEQHFAIITHPIMSLHYINEAKKKETFISLFCHIHWLHMINTKQHIFQTIQQKKK